MCVHVRGDSNPDLPAIEMLDMEVWAVPYEHTMRYTPEELQQVSSSAICVCACLWPGNGRCHAGMHMRKSYLGMSVGD